MSADDKNQATTSTASSLSSYTFRGRLRAEFPSQVIIDATEICNLACIHCPHPTFKKSEHYAGASLDPTLNAKAIDEIGTVGRGHTQYVRYTGEGEPLIHPKIFDLLGYAVKHSGTTVTLTTNGTILNDTRIEKLLECGVQVVDISIDAFAPETYAKVRVHGDLAVTRANVLRLLERAKASGGKTKVVVSYVEQPANETETKDFESFWRGNGADYVVVRRLHSSAGAVIQIARSLEESALREPRRPCLYPWERITLNPRGQLAFCPQDWVHGSALADYRQTTIREAWQGDFYRKLRQAHLTNDYASHAFCGRCPDWSQTRWPDEGRSYADMIQEFKARE